MPNRDLALKYPQLLWYTGSNSLWMVAFSLQSILVTWILVGILRESPERVGLAQLLIGVPGLVFMLWGGVIGDKVDGRKLLLVSQFLCILPVLALALANQLDLLGYWVLIITALVISLLNAASNPIRNTILNRLAGNRLQFAIGLTTGVGLIATIVGTKLGGEIKRLGLENILLIQVLIFAACGFVTLKLQAAPPAHDPSANKSKKSSFQDIGDGLRYIWELRLARDLIILNTLSSFFNAGAWMVAIPFIVTEIYGGDALFFANLTIVFYFGSVVSNFLLLKFMPILRPGKIYLIMQLTRIIILLAIWVQPDTWIFYTAALFWGANMGITTVTSRTIIQEFPSAQYRSRVMSVFTLGMMSAAPVGSLILGQVIGFWGPLNALIPGVIASVLIFTWGYYSREIWNYESS